LSALKAIFEAMREQLSLDRPVQATKSSSQTLVAQPKLLESSPLMEI
jgi:hypothetical protein